MHALWLTYGPVTSSTQRKNCKDKDYKDFIADILNSVVIKFSELAIHLNVLCLLLTPSL